MYGDPVRAIEREDYSEACAGRGSQRHDHSTAREGVHLVAKHVAERALAQLQKRAGRLQLRAVL